MNEIIDAEATVALVPVERPSSLVVLAAPLDEIVAAQKSYQAVCVALLDDNDIQKIGKKEFKKRSAWNKLSVAFGVSVEEVRTVHERDERGRIVRTECVVRATAPNGRHSDGLGACDLYERCCDPGTCTKREKWPDSKKPTGHVHCTEFPCKQAHFSNPQHDIPATAFTRASNRAKADLFGLGEVSAEEITRHDETPNAEPVAQPTTVRNIPAKDDLAEAGEGLIDVLGLLGDMKPACAAYLRETFGPAGSLTLEQTNQATKIAAGWPGTAPFDSPPAEPLPPLDDAPPHAPDTHMASEGSQKRVYAISHKIGREPHEVISTVLGYDRSSKELSSAEAKKVNDYLSLRENDVVQGAF
jgi:hypothetical protein